MIESLLAELPKKFSNATVPANVRAEAKKRVLDTLGCFYGAYGEKPGRVLRAALLENVEGDVALWGTPRTVPAELAVWANGTCVRTLDYNDTYLSKEPCHPSDLIAALWAACELSGRKNQGRLLVDAIVLGYDVMCRLCDANSIRVRGWDHVTYLPIASAVSCSYIYGLNAEQTRHAIALAAVGNNALRQTRVGTISDWKAACAAYAARAGLAAARLAAAGFTGPSDIFAGRHGFFKQVSGEFKFPEGAFGSPWKIMETHTKYFPAEHHAQSAIEAAITLRGHLFPLPLGRGQGEGKTPSSDRLRPSPLPKGGGIRKIIIETFDVAVSIIGSEKEKWLPTTRETADHSMPYLVVAALLEGDVNLKQYERRLFLRNDVRRLMKRVVVKSNRAYTHLYPKKMPSRVSIEFTNGRRVSDLVLLPKGYAGRPMSLAEVQWKFERMASRVMGSNQQRRIVALVDQLDRLTDLKMLSSAMRLE